MCYHAVCAKREKSKRNADKQNSGRWMEERRVVPPVFWDKTKDSKTNCSAASISPIQLIIYGRPSLCLAAILFGALPPVLWYKSNMLLWCRFVTLDMWVFTFTFAYNNSWTQVFYLKRHMVTLTRSKLWLIKAGLCQSLLALFVLMDRFSHARMVEAFNPKRGHGTTNM